MCEPLLTTASHKAYSTVLGYQVSAYGWIVERHQTTAAITIKLDGHMLDTPPMVRIHFAFDVAVDNVRA